MASTNFTDGQTPLQASWFNDVNSVIYHLLSTNGVIPSSTAQIRANLGLSGMASQSASNIAVTGGKLDGVIIGASNPSPAVFTNLTVNNNFSIKAPVIQDFAGLTRRLTPTGGSFVREYADMTQKAIPVAVSQSVAGTVLTFATTDGINPGYVVSGTGISVGTTVVSKTSTTVTLSATTTLAVALNTTITFAPAIGSIEVGTFYNYDVLTNSRDQNDIVFGSFFSDVGGIFSFVSAPAGISGSTVAYNSWLTPFRLNLNNGNLAITGTLDQSFGGLIRILTSAAGARIREYADIAPLGGFPTIGNIEIGTTYNASINVTAGTWLGRDITDACWVEKVSDAAPYTKVTFFAPSSTAGTTPVWAQTYARSLETGSISLGTVADLATTTPVFLDLGGTFSSVAGANMKLRLYPNWGIGVSSASMDYVTAAAGAHTFYGMATGIAISAKIGTTAAHMILSAGAATVAPLKFTPGVELTAATAGAMEFDGTNFYLTPNTTVGRQVIETKTEVYANVATVGAGTLTAANLFNGLIYRTGPTAIFTDTTDAATTIVLFTGTVVGSSFEFTYVNSVAFAATIAPGAGVTLAGNTPTTVGASAVKKYLGVVTSATTVTLYGI